MTIQAFSERVGVAKSAIRYYETKGLLGPVERNASGYRLYREDQVETVRLITSLRMADIAIADIQVYLNVANKFWYTAQYRYDVDIGGCLQRGDGTCDVYSNAVYWVVRKYSGWI